jgi:hypothetical protein
MFCRRWVVECPACSPTHVLNRQERFDPRGERRLTRIRIYRNIVFMRFRDAVARKCRYKLFLRRSGN